MNQQNGIRQAYSMLNKCLKRYDNLCPNAIEELEIVIRLLDKEVSND